MTPQFRASAAVIDVTPPIGFPLGGYMLRTGVSTGILDPILARLLLLTSGDDALLLISLDWVHIDGSWAGGVMRAIETETGIGGDRTIITATHTHSGPAVFRSSIAEADGEPAYLAVVSERIVDTAGTLMAAARDVTPLFGSTKVTGIGTHRNVPGLAVDDELSVLILRGNDTAVVGRVIAYGCHPTLLGPDNLLFSADWVGCGLAALDRMRGGGVSVFINGAAGDVSTRFTREGKGARELEKYASLFSEAEIRAETGAVLLSGAGIKVTTADVPVRYRDLPDRDEAQKNLSKTEDAIAAAASAGASPGEIRRLESVREGALVSLFFATRGGLDALFGERTMTVTVTLVRIGLVRMIFFPGEVMSGSAVSLKAGTRDPLVVCGYANGYFGYLSGGGGDYESSMTLLSPDSIERILRAARRLISEGM
jgi:neutral ceramidase